jgi:hypothetical protein
MGESLRIKVVGGLVFLGMLAVPFSRPAAAQAITADQLKLRVGDMAPDFQLQYFDGKSLKDVRLSYYRDKKSVVLAFYIFAFTGG